MCHLRTLTQRPNPSAPVSCVFQRVSLEEVVVLSNDRKLWYTSRFEIPTHLFSAAPTTLRVTRLEPRWRIGVGETSSFLTTPLFLKSNFLQFLVGQREDPKGPLER